MARNQNTMPSVRCAIYTRKSTEEGLEQEFNSLDAQREACEAFALSQRHEGWQLVPDRYDDGGFTGGNTERPALQRLFRDIEAGKIDCVIVYKVDRLSRSLLDFGKMMEMFDHHRVSFVSVTQQFNTSNSVGRLMLNVLLSFAQFEREIIAERTRDKLSAMRKKGKWIGGLPPLGYDVDRSTNKLQINEDEAKQVKAIFELYCEEGSLLPTVDILRERGWKGKQCSTKKGTTRGGKLFTRTSLHRLLTNVTYTGKILYQNQTYAGEHPAIIEPALFQRVQLLLSRNGQTGGAVVRNQFGAILKGLLQCGDCQCAMTPTHTTKKGKRYRYYACVKAEKIGRKHCPTKSISASSVEDFVIERIRCVGRDPELIEKTIQEVQNQQKASRDAIEFEDRNWAKELKQAQQELQHLSAKLAQDQSPQTLELLAALHQRITQAEERRVRLKVSLEELDKTQVHADEIRSALRQFDEVWESLTAKEQAKMIALLVEEVRYNGSQQTISIQFRSQGVQTLAQEIQQAQSKGGKR